MLELHQPPQFVFIKPYKKRRRKFKFKKELQLNPLLSSPWWELLSVQYAFSHPRVRSRLERLMGSNLVSLTDRQYMLKLQERILQDYADEMDKRIKAREAEERERVKRLVLNGTIPLKKAPPEMAEHPIMLIEHYCNRIIAEMRRDIVKIPKIVFPEYMYPDDTPDPPPGLSVERGHIYRKGRDRLCKPVLTSLATSEEDDIKSQYMYTEEEYARLKYRSPIISELMACETVEEMYALADEILGVLKEFRDVEEEEQSYDVPQMVSTMIEPINASSERQRIVKLA